MKKGNLFLLGMLAVLLTFGMTLSGCTTTSGTERAPWADQSVHTSKEYVVVGAVIIRTTNTKTLNADLMEKAVELGAHDIINVRIDVESDGQNGQKILAATAVAIKYTDETLKSGTTAVTADGLTTTSGDIGKDLLAKSDSSTQSSEEAPKRKKFLGIF
ncbi:MAG: YbjQ family protein [Treponema sp.]|jgi:hypothetical protein|nr:YbjQ family protein [Treponema sp.]